MNRPTTYWHWIVIALSVWFSYVLTLYTIPLHKHICINPTDLLATAKTGDILLFVATDYHAMFHLINPYSHIAVIVRTTDGDSYVVEAHNDDSGPGNRYPKGIFMYPLKERATPTAFTTPYFVRLQRPIGDREPHIDRDALARQVNKWNVGIEYNKSYKMDEALCHFLGIRPNIKKKMHCANFAAMLLHHLGIASSNAVYDCIRPIDVVSTLALVPGYAYTHIQPVAK